MVPPPSPAPPGGHEVEHDRRAEHGGDGADGHVPGGEGSTGDQVTAQTEGRAPQKAGRDHHQGLRRAEQGLDEVGGGDAHKGDGPGEGGDAGGEDAGEQNQLHPKPPDVHPHVPGVDLPHLVGPDGLGQQEGEEQGRPHHQGHQPHALPAGAGEAAQRPVVEVDDVGVVGESHHEVGDGGADIADHNAADHQHAHLLHPAGEQENEPHGEHGAGEGCGDQGHGPDHYPPAEQEHHHQGHRQLGPRGDPQHEGPGDGVGEKGLEQEAGHAQRPAQDGRGQHAGQADAPDDAGIRPGQQGGQDLPRREVHAAGADVPHQQGQHQPGQQKEAEGVPPGVASRCFS